MSNNHCVSSGLKFLCAVMVVFFCVSANAFAQANKKISISANGESLTSVLSQIEKLSGYYKYNYVVTDVQQYKVTVDVKDQTVSAATAQVLKGLPLNYSVDGKFVQIYKPADSVSGTVVSATDGEPIAGATIMVKNGRVGTSSDAEGKFTINHLPANAQALVVSFVGFKSTEIALGPKTKDVRVRLEEAAESLNDVEIVATGMMDRRRESFTGATTTFSQAELVQVGNQNLIKSLASLDPALQIIENLDLGSNPNRMPDFQLRGATSFNIAGDYEGNANQPLFILDGFEASMEKIWDLDMNRVQSVTILKDAAAKAIYGSKAGNGVVVINTIRPKTGEMRISYVGDLNIEAPDLSDYNLMNAQEKYDWEMAHHKFDGAMSAINPMAADLLHKEVYDAISSGIDTYWLSKPLRNGVGQKHSLSLEGGDSRIRYILGISYNNVAGVMKGSDRNTFDINSTLSYTYKNMVFRNQMDYTNNKSSESPYGSFSDYVGLEPYWAPYDESGNTKQILGYHAVNQDGSFSTPVYNPLYNASLNTMNGSKYTAFQDNFDLDWHINENWRITGQFSYMRRTNQTDVFYPANHTMFINYDANGWANRKGRYSKLNGETDNLTLQAGVNYTKTWGKHAMFLNGTWNLQTSKFVSSTVVAEGFGLGSDANIAMGTSYLHDSHPMGSDSETREIGLVGVANYSYDDRYLIDASMRGTGSSVYGSDNHWGKFWSAGAGWNIHNEGFLEGNELVRQLKLRYSIGYTGTQNFNPYQARAKYQYGTIFYDGRIGADLIALPNERLQWQRVYDNNLGLDIALGSFFTARAEYYTQNTDNMLTDITLPSSTGFSSYKENMGELQNKGFELAMSYTPWRDNSKRGWITISATALHNKNKIAKIYDIFDKMNDDADKDLSTNLPSGNPTQDVVDEYLQKTTRPATKYYEGCSMTAIWGVRSLGIDPQTGLEMFLDKDGKVTTVWNSADQVVIGDTNPKLRGTVSLSGGWNGITVNLVAQYKLGGDIYNTTLIDRVENVTGYGNLDKRVAQSWTKPGDNARYRQVDLRSTPTWWQNYTATRPTSRFVQKNAELYFTSINVGYDFYKMAWVKQMGLERLKLTFYANELARLSTVRVERGLSYPFARTFSFSLNATF